ncbi:uncharacterized protein MONBRDRAFT_27954 [Monosiga brevicollis MX1]|uniref:Cell division cycle protein 123 n=1 Tax=Monosiga brevicollis TaxID=81824 RepID=A9V6I2_MONBE|nr:uncharacterized protein MONBRDRAFT_27954 [Monosiga brevicollis MX1]EDQ86889.1 predicted protein [Monosiga brevicollis MX1]|eukprot:XP_001748434.1 hypothetical protein [Monosiga brevicollis MX1]
MRVRVRAGTRSFGIGPLPHREDEDMEDDSTAQQSTTKSNEPTGHENSDDSDEEEEARPLPTFPELQVAITKAIAELGGEVFPKLNWSAPKDAVWISQTNSLKCRTAGDVFLLLKSSTHAQHDLLHAYRCCQPPHEERRPEKVFLVLKNYWSSAPSQEFRCFVRQGQLVAISQRHVDQHFPNLAQLATDIRFQCYHLYHDDIKRVVSQPHLSFDVICDGNRAILLDINAWTGDSDPLLYTWQELEALPAATSNSERDPEPTTYCTDEELEQFMQAHQAQERAQTGDATLAAVEPTPMVERTQTDRLNAHLLSALMRQLDVNGSPGTVGDDQDAGDDQDEWAEAPTLQEDEESVGDDHAAKNDEDNADDTWARQAAIVFRVVDDPQPLKGASLATHAYPRDVVELAANGDVEVMMQALVQAQQAQNEDK